MSVYRELDPIVEHRTQFAFKGKKEHMTKVNIPGIGCKKGRWHGTNNYNQEKCH